MHRRVKRATSKGTDFTLHPAHRQRMRKEESRVTDQRDSSEMRRHQGHRRQGQHLTSMHLCLSSFELSGADENVSDDLKFRKGERVEWMGRCGRQSGAALQNFTDGSRLRDKINMDIKSNTREEMMNLIRSMMTSMSDSNC